MFMKQLAKVMYRSDALYTAIVYTSFLCSAIVDCNVSIDFLFYTDKEVSIVITY